MQRRQIGQSGPSIPVLALGTAQIGGAGEPLTEAAACGIVAAAVRAGIELFETGPLPGAGLAEHRLGSALRDIGGNPLIATRVGHLLRHDPEAAPAPGGTGESLPFRPVPDLSHDGLLRAFEDSQQRLALPRIDIVIFEFPKGAAALPAALRLLDSGFAALDALRSAGAISAIAFDCDQPELVRPLLSGSDPDLIFCPGRLTLLDHSADDWLLPLCRQARLPVVATSPFNTGILASRPTSRSLYQGAAPPPDILARARQIEALCQSYGVPLPAAALQFPLTRKEVVSVVAGMSSVEEVAQNKALMQHPIPQDLWDELAAGRRHTEEAELVTD